MSSHAFSNEYGFRYHWDWARYVRTITPDDGSPPYEEDWSGGVINGWSRRPDAVTHGDHKHPTEYGRSHVRMDFRQPQRIQRYTWLQIYEDLTTDAVSPGTPDRYWELMANAQSACNVKALNRLRGKNTAEIGSSIGQARQTAEEIAGSTTSVLKAYLAARKGNWASAANHLGLNRHSVANGTAAAQGWLSLIYGWLPLMGDIHDSCNRLVNGYRTDKWPIHVTANEYVSYTSPEGIDNGHKVQWTCTGKVHYRYDFTIANAFLDSLDGSGVLNPLSIAWELQPFSFVADWFVPVGNVLDSLSATMGLDFVSGFRTITSDCHLDVRSAPEIFEVLEPGWTTLDYYSMNRHVLPDFEPPDLYANTNPFKSSTRILNAVALIRQCLF